MLRAFVRVLREADAVLWPLAGRRRAVEVDGLRRRPADPHSELPARYQHEHHPHPGVDAERPVDASARLGRGAR